MIYVDDVFDYGSKTGKFCHMWSDTCDRNELHGFADMVGIKRCWFHFSKGVSGEFPHYDLRPHQRTSAIKAGAVERSLQSWVRERMEGVSK